MSLALVDSLICFEMPLFAIAHVSLRGFSRASGTGVDPVKQYAFRASDYIDDSLKHAVRGHISKTVDQADDV